MLVLTIATMMLAAIPTASAQNENNNRGTIKIHDELEVDPPQQNQPHVSCDFWVEAFNMKEETGRLEFRAWPPTGDKSVVTPTGDSLTYTGTPDGDGEFDFLKGAYFLEPGHYKVEAIAVDGQGRETKEKSKVFWVDPCEEGIECPPMDLTATANADGSISLNWTDVGEAADEYNIYRSAGGGALVFLDSTSDTTYTDESTTVGVSYTYAITIVKDGRESEICARAQATAIPFFGAPILAALALAGSVGAFAVLRRRK